MNDFEQPDAFALAHSEKLQKKIIQEIQNNAGKITFSTFMSLALYSPGLGYYSAGATKFGRDGDFITAPECSSLFSQCIANFCKSNFKQLKENYILEFGAGTGAMALEILQWLEVNQSLPKKYFILEPSADLQERQKTTLLNKVPHLFSSIQWLKELPEDHFNGIIIGNEVLDAMPVHRVKIDKNSSQEYYIAYQDGKLVWELGELSSQALHEKIEQLRKNLPTDALENAYITEIHLHSPAWIKSIATQLKQAIILLIDYGYLEKEYYLPERSMGTLMCYYRHRGHDDPLQYIGLQDITSHVNFSAIVDAAYASGLEIAGYTSQASFLLACGLMQLIPSDASTEQQMVISQQVKRLIFPNEMGEIFKVMAITKAIKEPLIGFL